MNILKKTKQLEPSALQPYEDKTRSAADAEIPARRTAFNSNSIAVSDMLITLGIDTANWQNLSHAISDYAAQCKEEL